MHFNLTQQPGILLFLLLIVLVVSLLSGFYPAMILSSFQPVLVLKNYTDINTGKAGSAWMRKALTVSQFVIAQVFIIATILVGKQISYTLNKDLCEACIHNPASMYIDLNFSHYPLSLRNYFSKEAGEGTYNQFMTYTKVLKDFRASGKFSDGEANLNLEEGPGNSLYRLIAQADEVYKISKIGRPL